MGIICLACLLYKCRTNQTQKRNDQSDAPHINNYGDETISEEDQLMIPVDREDTIDSLRHQLSQVNVANVRYVQIASVDQEFRIKDGIEPRTYLEGDIVTFRDIAIGFVDGIPDKINKKTNMSKRASVIYSICVKQLHCDSITEMSQIQLVIVYLCKIIIRLRYNKPDKKTKAMQKNVIMRDENSEEFKIDILPICEWIWLQKMEKIPMEIKTYSEQMSIWMSEING